MCLRGVFAQGPKIPPGGLTGKPWNRGAPLSKKSTGIGKHRGAKGRYVSAGDVEQAEGHVEQAETPPMGEMRPLPASVEGILDPHTRELLSRGEVWRVDADAPPTDLL